MPRKPRMTGCKDCLGHGWLLVTLDGIANNQRIERCDNCDRFKTDSEANAFVAKLAWSERFPKRRIHAA